MTQRYNAPFQTAFDDSGNIIPNAQLDTFEAGTSTPLATYTDPALTTPHTNPVEADAAGRFPDIYLAKDTYKFVLKDADDVIIRTSDDYDNESAVSSTEDNTFTGNITMDGAVINEDKGVDIASAATTDLGTATGNTVTVTGTTTITSFGTAPAGAIRRVIFADILTLTYNASSLILPTEADITTQAGDVGVFVSLGSANWKTVSYERQDGTALAIAPVATGKVLQVVSVTKTDIATISSSTFGDIAGLSAAITPASASNKILVTANISDNADLGDSTYVIDRDGTDIGIGNAAGSRTQGTTGNHSSGASSRSTNSSLSFEDSPSSIIEVTYKIQARVTGGTLEINRNNTDTDNSSNARLISTLTLMEIEG